ncbi:MAG: hypothetical protein DME26_05235 [Verrucomicrobia bacterium]|nr:MAG: hypothetical protein DME26_05235 [Verrucomicrobiota bacterium]
MRMPVPLDDRSGGSARAQGMESGRRSFVTSKKRGDLEGGRSRYLFSKLTLVPLFMVTRKIQIAATIIRKVGPFDCPSTKKIAASIPGRQSFQNWMLVGLEMIQAGTDG